jgi:hypothetical protein
MQTSLQSACIGIDCQHVKTRAKTNSDVVRKAVSLGLVSAQASAEGEVSLKQIGLEGNILWQCCNWHAAVIMLSGIRAQSTAHLMKSAMVSR